MVSLVLRVIDCIRFEHDLSFVALAGLVCVVGSYLTVMLGQRALRATGRRHQVHMALYALIGGATIWSTHFIAMLAYEPGVPHGYEPIKTAVSLFLGILGMALVLRPLGKSTSLPRILLSGWLLGNTITIMHYVGMSGYQIPGELIWDRSQVALSVVMGCALGALAVHRMVKPVTRYCWLFGLMFLVLSICAMHFTGMSAATLQFSPLIQVPDQLVPDAVLGLLVFGVTAAVFLVGFASIHLEIQMEREALNILTHTVNHDQLTGLPNRKQLLQRLDDAAMNPNARHAMLTMDLNTFKQINDLHGHSVGDALLVEVAQRMTSCLQKGEFIARTGGDEFVGVKTGIAALADAQGFAERLLSATKQPIKVGHLSLQVSVSVGLATDLQEWTSPQDLLQRSDIAMQYAKASSDEEVRGYDAEMERAHRERLYLMDDLAKAVERGQLRLVYQLQNDTITGDALGVEALLRWDHPDRGPIRPDIFIPLAEETGFIRPIGRWVLEQACAEAMRWEKPLTVAVNVAPQQITHAPFPDELRQILKSTGLAPSRLELEVTEASVINDPKGATENIHDIKAMGVRIAMDDFGTGYSSLATLQSFPFDKIKIDKSFVRDIHLDDQRAAIVRAIMLLGAAMKMPVLAEGVETEDELALLRDLRCDVVQGFLYGKPYEACDLAPWTTFAKTKIAS